MKSLTRFVAAIAATVTVFAVSLVATAPTAQAVVPPATGNNAVITVKTGSDRSGTSSVTGLAGVTLGFYDTAVGGTAAFQCTSDVDGDCSITVPNTQTGGANRDRQFYVRQIGTPAGYYTNSTLAVGTTPAAQAYTFQTATQLRNGSTYSSTTSFMVATGNTNDVASGGIWQDSRSNPVFPAQCGINVAIVADLSNSVTATDLTNLKGAATTFVNALTGTPSNASLFTFGTNSPASAGANQNRTGLMPVSTSAGASVVNGYINGWTLPGGNAGGTNWDQAMQAVATAPQKYDVVVVITDGNPTYYGNPVQGPGSRTRFREVENGIFSANAVKAQGSRIVAVGVGDGIGGSPANLRSISGPVADSDYYQASDYTAAGAALRALALGNCNGTLSVVKQVVPPGTPAGSTAGAQPAPGWTFDAAVTGGVTVAPASGQTAAGTGALNFSLTFPGGTTTTTATVTETQQAGYTIHPIGGSNAVCRRVDTGDAVTVTDVGATGFSVPAASTYPVSCTVYNQAPQPPATILVAKDWIVNGTTYPEGSQPPELSAALQLDGTAADWSTTRAGYNVGQTVVISETSAVASSSLCTITNSRLTNSNNTPVDLAVPYSATLPNPVNTYTITNTVTCPARLTLDKTVVNGPASPSAWTLTATAPSGALAGPSGTTGVNAPVTPSVTYPLAESAGDPRYVQLSGPNAVAIPGSTISWVCSQVDPRTGAVIAGFSDGLNGGVTIPPGFAVTCTARNQTASLTLVKQVQNTHGGTAVPGDWNLTADPGTNSLGLTPQTVQGSAAGTQMWVRPGQSYHLTESAGPAGYSLASLRCVTELDPVPRELASITLQVGEAGTCTYINVDQPARITLVKTVTNDNGGNAVATAWTLAAAGPTAGVSGKTGDAAVTDAPVNAGTYTLSESGGPSGYTAGTWSCTVGTMNGSSVALAVGQSTTCTLDNNDQPAILTLAKTVTNDNGGTSKPTDWVLSADGPTPVSGATGSDAVTEVAVDAGTYDLSESGPGGYTAGDWSCAGSGTLTGSSLTLTSGSSASCTLNNDDQPAKLTLVKVVDAAATGSGKVPADWTLTATGPTTVSGNGDPDSAGGVNAETINAGSYSLSESGPTGFTAGSWDCTGADFEGADVTVPNGGDVTCTITNTAVAPHLTLVKTVDHGQTGDTTPATAWTLAASGPSSISGVVGASDVTNAAVEVGTYTLSESGPGGYTASTWSCSIGGGTPTTGASVTLGEGEAATCTIANTTIAPRLTLEKTVTNKYGGTASKTDWTLTADGPETLSGTTDSSAVTDHTAQVGVYDLSESGGPAGYEASGWTCTGTDASTPSTVTLVPGDDVTCRIVNSDIPAQLTLIKTVDNGNSGATTPATAWTLSATGPDTITGATGSADVTNADVSAGSYDLSESGPSGYAASDWTCTTGESQSTGSTRVLALGQHTVCRIQNAAIDPTLTLVKVVHNDHGGTAVATDWTVTAAGPASTTISGKTGSAAVTQAAAVVGTFRLSESGGPTGYDPSPWVCEGAVGSTGNTVTLASGDNATCTITNSDQVTLLTLAKIVRNTHGGTNVPADWTLTATGPTKLSGVTGSAKVTSVSVVPGSYALAESGPSGYTASAWTCTGADASGSSVTVASGTHVVCTITNSDQEHSVPPILPVTGGGIVPWGLPALGLIGAGILLLVFSRRRRA